MGEREAGDSEVQVVYLRKRLSLVSSGRLVLGEFVSAIHFYVENPYGKSC